MIRATYVDHMGSDLTVANAARGKKSELEDDHWGFFPTWGRTLKEALND